MPLSLRKQLSRFRRDQDGAVLVEFALVFPLVLLFFAISVEIGRMFWSYGQVVAGVRDASRYLARVAPVDICAGGGTPSLASYTSAVTSIVTDEPGTGYILSAPITVNSVTPDVTCVPGSLRISPVPVASVTANFTMNLPFGGAFTLFGALPSSVTASVTDQARVFGQ